MSTLDRPELKILGQQLAELRLRAKLTQASVGEVLGFSDHTIGQWEAGRREPSIAELCRLANLYSSSLAEIFLPLERWVPPTPDVEEITVLRSVRRTKGR